MDASSVPSSTIIGCLCRRAHFDLRDGHLVPEPAKPFWVNEERKKTASKKRISALFKAEIFLQVMAVEVDRIEVRHWDNDGWGEIPADFGHK